jgi:hypothetical protein
MWKSVFSSTDPRLGHPCPILQWSRCASIIAATSPPIRVTWTLPFAEGPVLQSFSRIAASRAIWEEGKR